MTPPTDTPTALPTTVGIGARLDPRRWLFAGLGVMCVGIGALGVFVPGLPTTVFLIAGSWCFAKSCPWMEQIFIRNKFFRPFLGYLEPGAHMPVRAKVVTCCVMWLAIAASTLAMLSNDAATWVLATVLAAGAVGTWCIVRIA